MLPVSALAQSPITFQYFYDDLNQLVKVIDSTGVVIQYIYDPVGNILQINRAAVAPGALTIFNVTPLTALQGGTITIQGQGFNANPALDVVTIGGQVVTVVSATATTLVISVPVGSMSGSISVTVGGVTITSPNPETVIPAPIITSVKPRVMQAGTIATVTVTGANFANTTFLIPGSGITAGVSSLAPDGTSAVLILIANATANGQFAVVGSNGAASSPAGVTNANAFSAFVDPTLDPDGDGLPNSLELIFGTDPFNADTDGDGFPDGVEVASRSDGLDPNSTPLNTRLYGDAESLTSGISNVGFTPTTRGESDSISFAVLNRGATPQEPIESDSKTFSLLDVLPTKAVPAESDSLTISVVNNPGGTSSPNEADSIPFSVCNATLGPASCSDYSALSLVSKLQGIGRTPGAGTNSRAGSGTTGPQGPANGLPFSVLAVAPANAAARIAPRAPDSTTITLVFSAPLDPASIALGNAPGNFSLVAGDRAIDPEIRYSADFRTVTLRASLPPDASILVHVSNQVRDIWGRPLPAFQSEFHTAAAPREASRATVAQYPPAGATAVSPSVSIHLSPGRAVDWNLARNALSITQDGEPVEGRIQVTQSGKDVEFIPYAPLRSGAVIAVSLDGTGEPAGQLADRFEGLFTTAASAEGIAEPLRAVPGGVTGAPLNPVLEFEYGRPLGRSTVTPATVTLSTVTQSGDLTSQPVAATVLLRGDHIIRVTPSAFLLPGSTYTVEVSDSVQDIAGQSANPIRQSFTAAGEAISGLPRLLSTTPADAATDIDANTEVHLLFDRPINPLTLDSDTVRLSQDGALVAISISISKGGNEVIVTPLGPLNDSVRVQLTISGVEDLTGGTLPLSTVRFQVRKAAQAAGAQLASNGEGARQRPRSAGRRFFVFLIGRRR